MIYDQNKQLLASGLFSSFFYAYFKQAMPGLNLLNCLKETLRFVIN